MSNLVTLPSKGSRLSSSLIPWARGCCGGIAMVLLAPSVACSFKENAGSEASRSLDV